MFGMVSSFLLSWTNDYIQRKAETTSREACKMGLLRSEPCSKKKSPTLFVGDPDSPAARPQTEYASILSWKITWIINVGMTEFHHIGIILSVIFPIGRLPLLQTGVT